MISGRYRLITPDEQLPYRDVEVWQAADTLLGTKVRMILLPRDLPNRAAALDARADALLAEFVPRADETFTAVSGKLRNK